MKKRLTTVLTLLMVMAFLVIGVEPTASQTPPSEVTVTEAQADSVIQLAKSDMVVLQLESNPSTGFRWEVADMDRRVLRQLKAGADEFVPESDLLGAPGIQMLRFVGVSKGRSPLRLVYRRPWEDAAPLKTFAVEVESAGEFTGVYNVLPEPIIEEPLPEQEEDPTALALPSSFNWCDQGGCTPVKNQGSCGSCWAFGTVGPFESVIRLQDGITRDLSEQYLVSCNAEGWGCNGGWWAHDYHEWKYISGESGPGAVYESNFPYRAADVPCNPPHSHPYRLDDWVQITSGDASTSVLKQAIYDHGPLSVAVCANSAMSSYSGGIFTGPSCTSVNHAVVLTGWNDGGQYWHMRNSWGTGWGESGYMRIRWGVSRIGYRPAYVVYGGGPSPTPSPTPGSKVLHNGVPVTNLSGSTGSEDRYTMNVPSGASNLRFQISGGSGDADLYVKFGSPPTTSSYDCRPYLNGNNETCTFASPQVGTYYVMLRGYSSYSGVTLVGSYSTAGPTPTPTSGPGPNIFFDNFETSLGWTRNAYGTDTATTGVWERANPASTSYGGTYYQLGTTTSGSYDLVTGGAAGSSVGSYDLDGGTTSARSPAISLPSSGDITLSFNYYLAHYNNASSSDYLRVQVIGNTTSTVFQEVGAANIDGASWASFNTSLNAFRGQTIYLFIEAADGGSASLVEAAIDDVAITGN